MEFSSSQFSPVNLFLYIRYIIVTNNSKAITQILTETGFLVLCELISDMTFTSVEFVTLVYTCVITY